MTSTTLAQSYLTKAAIRLKILPVLHGEADYSDVVREAQEIVELALKGMLRSVGIDPPKWHDVGDILLEHAEKFTTAIREELPELARISKRLRKERELSFYGDIDFIPTEEYTAADAEQAMTEARFVVEMAAKALNSTNQGE